MGSLHLESVLLLLILACHWSPPTSTSSTGMAGRVLAANGTPIEGLEVLNLEMATKTNPQGEFGLYYKRPDLHASFERDEIWYRRVYRPEDDGARVDITLPATQPLQVDCAGLACDLELRWDLGDGLQAQVRKRCDAGVQPAIPHAPAGSPEVLCRQKGTLVTDRAKRIEGHLTLQTPPRQVTFLIQPDGDVGRCTLTVDEQTLAFIDGGVQVELTGDAWVQVKCDERPGVPQHVGPAATEVTLQYASVGPTLQPPAGIELPHLRLSQRGQPWVLVAEADPEGVFALPPLPVGTYVVQLHSGTPAVVPPDLAATAPDVLIGELTSSGDFVFAVDLAVDLTDGILEPALKEAP